MYVFNSDSDRHPDRTESVRNLLLEKVRRDSAVDILILGNCGRVDFLFPKKVRQKRLSSF